MVSSSCLSAENWPPDVGSHRSGLKSRPNTVRSGHRTIKIAVNPRVSAGLRRAWKHIECLSVADYLQTLTGAVAELKRDVNYSGEIKTSEFELLSAFDSAVRDGSGKRDYSISACRMLVEGFKDMDAPFGDVEEAEAW